MKDNIEYLLHLWPTYSRTCHICRENWQNLEKKDKMRTRTMQFVSIMLQSTAWSTLRGHTHIRADMLACQTMHTHINWTTHWRTATLAYPLTRSPHTHTPIHTISYTHHVAQKTTRGKTHKDNWWKRDRRRRRNSLYCSVSFPCDKTWNILHTYKYHIWLLILIWFTECDILDTVVLHKWLRYVHLWEEVACCQKHTRWSEININDR